MALLGRERENCAIGDNRLTVEADLAPEKRISDGAVAGPPLIPTMMKDLDPYI
jgi:hypothetical protein